jgi:hypothetical protein
VTNPDPAPGGRPTPTDPVLAKRARVLRLTQLGQRIGYGLFGVAVVLFFIGLTTSYNDPLVTGIVATMVVGSLVLAPAIVFSYGVKAADRADREDDW